MKNKNRFFLFLLLLLIITACSEVSDEALEAGFKSDIDYYNHLEVLRIKRDESFKEKILYAANINAFDTDSSYELAVDKLEKNLRKYLPRGLYLHYHITKLFYQNLKLLMNI